MYNNTNMNTLPKDIEDIILDYKNQLEHSERYEPVLQQIRNMEYYSNPLDNCMSYKIRINNTLKTYHIKFCNICGRYYRSTIIHYVNDETNTFRYSHYNTYLNDMENILTADYIVNYGGDTLYWTNYYNHRPFNKYISCDCMRRLSLLL